MTKTYIKASNSNMSDKLYKLSDFIPEYLRFITLNTLSTLFLLEYISFLNVLILNLLYHPCLKLNRNGIWSDAFISSFMHVLIAFESYALSAIIN